MADDIDELIKHAEQQGWTVDVNSDGYKYFVPPGGSQWVARHPNTPSRKGRRFTEVRLALKRHGLEWPPPSKKELKARRRKEGK